LAKYENNEYVKRYYPDRFGDKKPVTVPQTVVAFEFDKSFIHSDFYEGLSKYVRYLKVHNNALVYITGHSDLTGTDERCWGISEERIENVRRYFLAQGIAANRILSKAYGRSNPVWKKEKFEWQARENRRVDLIVYE
jgi:outer membrane protein OmpA-like peptidoglycan-associated protein